MHRLPHRVLHLLGIVQRERLRVDRIRARVEFVDLGLEHRDVGTSRDAALGCPRERLHVRVRDDDHLPRHPTVVVRTFVPDHNARPHLVHILRYLFWPVDVQYDLGSSFDDKPQLELPVSERKRTAHERVLRDGLFEERRTNLLSRSKNDEVVCPPCDPKLVRRVDRITRQQILHDKVVVNKRRTTREAVMTLVLLQRLEPKMDIVPHAKVMPVIVFRGHHNRRDRTNLGHAPMVQDRDTSRRKWLGYAEFHRGTANGDKI